MNNIKGRPVVEGGGLEYADCIPCGELRLPEKKASLGLFTAKTILVEEHQWYFFQQGDKGFIPFLRVLVRKWT